MPRILADLKLFRKARNHISALMERKSLTFERYLYSHFISQNVDVAATRRLFDHDYSIKIYRLYRKYVEENQTHS